MFGLSALETILVLLVLVIAGMYLYRGPLANVLRSKAKAKELELANALDNANDRILAAQSTTETKLANGEKGKVMVKGARKLIEMRYNDAKAAVQKYDLAAQSAAMANRADLVERAVAKLQAARKTLAGLEPAYQKLVASESQVVSAVQILKDRKASLKTDQQVIKGRSTAATVSMDANQLVAGLNADGTSEDIAKAYEILDEAEAQAGAWQEMADEVKNAQSLDDELEALASGGSQGDDVSRYMAEYGPKTDASVK